jgi:hypothetical protein
MTHKSIHRRRRIAPRSKLGARRAAIYAKVRADYLRENRWCKVALLLPGPGRGELVEATQVHHSRGKLGPLLIDTRFFVAVSAASHDWIERNKNDARRYGFLCERGLFNSPPRDAETERLREVIAEQTYNKEKA